MKPAKLISLATAPALLLFNPEPSTLIQLLPLPPPARPSPSTSTIIGSNSKGVPNFNIQSKSAE
jgi:hypothetical protein